MFQITPYNKGFTALEVIVVVALIGVLAAIIIPNIASFIGSGEDEAKDTEFRNMQSAVLALIGDSKVYELDSSYEEI